MIEISIVVPVYKAEECLHELHRRLTESLVKITDNYEIILIEDCGGDKSWKIITELIQQDPHIKGYQFSRNFGQHYAITAGLDVAEGNWVVIMDCDLQDRPEEIAKLYHKATEGYDVVLARKKERQDPFFKKLFSRLFFAIFSYFLGIKYDSQIGNFRIISSKVVKAIRKIGEQLRFLGGMTTWLGFSTAYVDVTHAERFAGKSSYSLRKLLKLAINITLAYSDKPLQLVIRFGFMMSFIAGLYGCFIILKVFFYHVPVPGWSSLIASIYFIGGIIIANLGILGIYLGKIFNEVKKRPLYIIQNEAHNDSP